MCVPVRAAAERKVELPVSQEGEVRGFGPSEDEAQHEAVTQLAVVSKWLVWGRTRHISASVCLRRTREPDGTHGAGRATRDRYS